MVWFGLVWFLVTRFTDLKEGGTSILEVPSSSLKGESPRELRQVPSRPSLTQVSDAFCVENQSQDSRMVAAKIATRTQRSRNPP